VSAELADDRFLVSCLFLFDDQTFLTEGVEAKQQAWIHQSSVTYPTIQHPFSLCSAQQSGHFSSLERDKIFIL
jgi:hypothetical protein